MDAPLRQVVVTPTLGGGWRVSDREGELVTSVHPKADEARAHAQAHLAGLGGGELVVREGGRIVSISRIAPNVVQLPRRPLPTTDTAA